MEYPETITGILLATADEVKVATADPVNKFTPPAITPTRFGVPVMVADVVVSNSLLFMLMPVIVNGAAVMLAVKPVGCVKE
jgi:hypothetical protein